ncbi:hypothetical protein GWK47_011896 [Chionoecetes opilio]|uniref:Uncharacterized protein n=1 Tax=Chionoecetes opilio TaxID=41210 RepID=A0A8J4XXM4_CHIOP|nr:hypothetical protein GWK47_011896 [Chionoecetes opilio]
MPATFAPNPSTACMSEGSTRPLSPPWPHPGGGCSMTGMSSSYDTVTPEYPKAINNVIVTKPHLRQSSSPPGVSPLATTSQLRNQTLASRARANKRPFFAVTTLASWRRGVVASHTQTPNRRPGWAVVGWWGPVVGGWLVLYATSRPSLCHFMVES